MEITDILINGISSLVLGGGAGFCVFKFLGEKWVSNWFAKDLKTYEQHLELLKIRKSLQYSNVYTKRAEIITDIYNILVDYSGIEQELRDYLHHYVDDGHDNSYDLKDIIHKMEQINTSLGSKIDRNKLYFTTKDANSLVGLVSEIKSFTESFREYYEYDQDMSVSDYILSKLENTSSLSEVKDIRSALEERFRELIGVNN